MVLTLLGPRPPRRHARGDRATEAADLLVGAAAPRPHILSATLRPPCLPSPQPPPTLTLTLTRMSRASIPHRTALVPTSRCSWTPCASGTRRTRRTRRTRARRTRTRRTSECAGGRAMKRSPVQRWLNCQRIARLCNDPGHAALKRERYLDPIYILSKGVVHVVYYTQAPCEERVLTVGSTEVALKKFRKRNRIMFPR